MDGVLVFCVPVGERVSRAMRVSGHVLLCFRAHSIPRVFKSPYEVSEAFDEVGTLRLKGNPIW